jgi:hypothetical protein
MTVTTITEYNECPGCRVRINAATGTDGVSVPTPGDISVCFNCGTLLVFNTDLTVRQLTLEELVGLDQETRDELEKIQKFLRKHKKDQQ